MVSNVLHLQNVRRGRLLIGRVSTPPCFPEEAIGIGFADLACTEDHAGVLPAGVPSAILHQDTSDPVSSPLCSLL